MSMEELHGMPSTTLGVRYTSGITKSMFWGSSTRASLKSHKNGAPVVSGIGRERTRCEKAALSVASGVYVRIAQTWRTLSYQGCRT
jgi:hypothetical protein